MTEAQHCPAIGHTLFFSMLLLLHGSEQMQSHVQWIRVISHARVREIQNIL